MESIKIMMTMINRSPFMPTQQTVTDPASVESFVEMKTPRTTYSATSDAKATDIGNEAKRTP
jgi:hypothetical protein